MILGQTLICDLMQNTIGAFVQNVPAKKRDLMG